MSAARLIKYLQFAYSSKTPFEKAIFRTIRSIGAGNLVEIGMGDGRLARRMIAQAKCYTDRARVSYTGIDLFELRGADEDPLTLRGAHRELNRLDARIRLIPGDVYSALARRANALLDTDLIVVRADQDAELLRRAWYYVPRMLHVRSRVIVEPARADQTPEVFDRAKVTTFADTARPHRRAA